MSQNFLKKSYWCIFNTRLETILFSFIKMNVLQSHWSCSSSGLLLQFSKCGFGILTNSAKAIRWLNYNSTSKTCVVIFLNKYYWYMFNTRIEAIDLGLSRLWRWQIHQSLFLAPKCPGTASGCELTVRCTQVTINQPFLSRLQEPCFTHTWNAKHLNSDIFRPFQGPKGLKIFSLGPWFTKTSINL